MSHHAKLVTLLTPRIKGLSVAPHNNRGLRFGCGIGLKAAVELPQVTNVARGTAVRIGL